GVGGGAGRRGEAEQFGDCGEGIADLIDKIDDLRQRIRDAMESYGTSVSNRQARIINRLTILSAIFLPLTFLTGFFGMNFQWLIESIASFRVFLMLGIGLFVATLVTTLALFRGRGWLDGDRRPSRANESSTVAGPRAPCRSRRRAAPDHPLQLAGPYHRAGVRRSRLGISRLPDRERVLPRRPSRPGDEGHRLRVQLRSLPRESFRRPALRPAPRRIRAPPAHRRRGIHEQPGRQHPSRTPRPVCLLGSLNRLAAHSSGDLRCLHAASPVAAPIRIPTPLARLGTIASRVEQLPLDGAAECSSSSSRPWQPSSGTRNATHAPCPPPRPRPPRRCPPSGPPAIASPPPRPSDHGRLGGVNPEGSRVVEAGSSLKRTPCARVPHVPQRWVVADSRCALVELPAYFVDARCQARPTETFDDDLEEGDFELVLPTAQECSALLAAW